MKREIPEQLCSAILVLSILALDLPITISYNYPTRFFLPMLPIFAILGALFIEDLYRQIHLSGSLRYQRGLTIALAAIILFSFARNISVMLLFFHDARIPASEFLNRLPAGTSLEHTFYPPTIPREHFEREHNYPIFFQQDTRRDGSDKQKLCLQCRRSRAGRSPDRLSRRG